MEHKHGWSKQKPTVFLDGERDRIDLQSGKIRANIFFPKLAQGIVPFINQFGKLWIGTMIQSYFIERFKSERKTLINNLKVLNGLKSDQYILQREADYLGVQINKDDLQALLDEITSLRQEVLDSQTTINDLTNNNG